METLSLKILVNTRFCVLALRIHVSVNGSTLSIAEKTASDMSDGELALASRPITRSANVLLFSVDPWINGCVWCGGVFAGAPL